MLRTNVFLTHFPARKKIPFNRILKERKESKEENADKIRSLVSQPADFSLEIPIFFWMKVSKQMN
jgi:hypothetical protein